MFVFVFCCSLLSQRVFKSICAGYTGCPKGHRELPHRRASIISRLPPYINIDAYFEMRVKLFLNIGVRNLRCILNVIFWGLRLHPSCTWVNYPWSNTLIEFILAFFANFFGISLPVFQTTGSFNMAWPSRKNIFWKFRQSRQEGGVVGEWGAESGKCATILCAHINAVRGNCARSHYEPSLTCEQWDHSASFASTWCLARKGQNKSRSLFPTSNI